MRNIKLVTKIKAASEAVFDVLVDMDKFPQFMRYVNSLKVAKKSPSRHISIWNINIDEAPVKWEEEDIIDKNNFIINFQMIKGDFSAYKGRWKIDSTSSGSKIELVVDIDWGAPAFTSFVEVDKILFRKTKKAFKTMLLAIKKEAEK